MLRDCLNLVNAHDLIFIVIVYRRYCLLLVCIQSTKGFLYCECSLIEMVDADADVLIFCVDYKMWQGGQWQSNNGRPVISYEPAQPKSRFEELSENLDFEPAMALIQLREDSGRSSDSGASAGELLRGSPDNRARFQPYVHKKSKAIKQLAENVATGSGGFVVEVNDKHNAQSSTNREQELHQQDLGHSSTHQPNPWPSTSGDPFLCEASAEHPVDVTDSLSGRKRKTEEIIELNLTMATRSPRPSLQFVSPPTPEEAALSLALS